MALTWEAESLCSARKVMCFLIAIQTPVLVKTPPLPPPPLHPRRARREVELCSPEATLVSWPKDCEATPSMIPNIEHKESLSSNMVTVRTDDVLLRYGLTGSSRFTANAATTEPIRQSVLLFYLMCIRNPILAPSLPCSHTQSLLLFTENSSG